MEGAKGDGEEERTSGGPRASVSVTRAGRLGLAGFGSPSNPTCKIPFR
jgi:hypothetical protein